MTREEVYSLDKIYTQEDMDNAIQSEQERIFNSIKQAIENCDIKIEPEK